MRNRDDEMTCSPHPAGVHRTKGLLRQRRPPRAQARGEEAGEGSDEGKGRVEYAQVDVCDQKWLWSSMGRTAGWVCYCYLAQARKHVVNQTETDAPAVGFGWERASVVVRSVDVRTTGKVGSRISAASIATLRGMMGRRDDGEDVTKGEVPSGEGRKSWVVGVIAGFIEK